MADYYSILEKTISGLPNNTPEVRNAVYKKARTAIETQLRNMNPVPSEDAISSQLKLLEEAIVLIDSEYTIAPDPLPVLEEEPPQAELAPEIAEPAPIEPPVVRDLPEAAPAPEQSIVPEPQQEIPSAAPQTSTSSIVTESKVPEAPASPAAPETAIDRIQSDVSDTPEINQAAPSLANVDPGSVSVDPKTKDILDPIVAADAINNPPPQVGMDEEKSGGGFGGILKMLVILGLLGGGGYGIWKNKDQLAGIFSSWISSAEVTEETSVPATTQAEEEVAQTPDPVEPEVTEPAVVEPETVEPETTQPETTQPETVEPEVVVPETVEPETTEETAQEQTQEETPSETQQSGVIPIGEVAYLYEEGSAGSGATRTTAAITWELRQESLKAGSPPEPVIVGKMDIPEKGMSIDIVLKRNIDEAVSASHMIEMKFNLPENFDGQSVESIARFVMKTTEEAPGEPLAAVPVKVSEGNFLIALDNLTQAVALNTQLLRGSAWIDVPIVYGTGKRALITLEKGGTGDRVFTQAFRDWQNR